MRICNLYTHIQISTHRIFRGGAIFVRNTALFHSILCVRRLHVDASCAHFAFTNFVGSYPISCGRKNTGKNAGTCIGQAVRNRFLLFWPAQLCVAVVSRTQWKLCPPGWVLDSSPEQKHALQPFSTWCHRFPHELGVTVCKSYLSYAHKSCVISTYCIYHLCISLLQWIQSDQSFNIIQSFIFRPRSKRIHMLRPSFSDQDRDDRASQVEDPRSPEMGQGKPPKLEVDKEFIIDIRKIEGLCYTYVCMCVYNIIWYDMIWYNINII